MLITNIWQEVASGTAVLRKGSTNPLTLEYSATAPDGTGVSFSLTHNNAEVYPAVIAKTLWAIARNGDVRLAIEETEA